jgi:hypothetical protein
MIRNVHQLACLCIGLLLAASVALFYEHWTWLLLAVCVPWDKVLGYADEAMTDWYEHRREQQMKKEEQAVYARIREK